MMKRRREDEVNYGAICSSTGWTISDQNGSESEAKFRLGSQQSKTLQYTTSCNTSWASGCARTPSTDDNCGNIPNSELNPANKPRYNNTHIDNNVTSSSPSTTIIETLSYLDQVKSKFNDQPEIFTKVLDIMRECKSNSTGITEVIQRMCNLFQGHIELIHGFNRFLPLGYKIEIQSNDQGISVPVISGPGGIMSLLSQTSPAHTSRSIVHQIPANPAPDNNASGTAQPNVHNILLTPQQQSAPTPIVLTSENYSRQLLRIALDSHRHKNNLRIQGREFRIIIEDHALDREFEARECLHEISYIDKD